MMQHLAEICVSPAFATVEASGAQYYFDLDKGREPETYICATGLSKSLEHRRLASSRGTKPFGPYQSNVSGETSKTFEGGT